MSYEISDRQRRYTLFMLVAVYTSSHVDRQIMGILGQPIKESLLISDTQLGLLTGIMFAVFYATLGMPMAMWADRNNRRNLISFSVFLWSLMTALCAAASNFVQLLLLRIGVGVGEAGVARSAIRRGGRERRRRRRRRRLWRRRRRRRRRR